MLKASHLSLLEGSKQISWTEFAVTCNPGGMGIMQRMNERVFRDVMNKLESSPVNLKPAWSGIRVGGTSGVKDSTVSKSKAQLAIGELVFNKGSSCLIGQQNTSPPDPGSGGNKMDALSSQNHREEGNQGDGERRSEGGGGICRMDDDMAEASPEVDTAGGSGL